MSEVNQPVLEMTPNYLGCWKVACRTLTRCMWIGEIGNKIHFLLLLLTQLMGVDSGLVLRTPELVDLGIFRILFKTSLPCAVQDLMAVISITGLFCIFLRFMWPNICGSAHWGSNFHSSTGENDLWVMEVLTWTYQYLIKLRSLMQMKFWGLEHLFNTVM